MPNPLLNIVERLKPSPRIRRAWAYLSREAIGIAQDFWKDGNGEKPHNDDDWKPLTEVIAAEPKSESADGLWSAKPGEISEKMWGAGYVTPADDYVTERLIRPLGLNKDMNVLDLSAGLGGRLIKTTQEFGVYITGLEPDPEIAERGVALAAAAGRKKHIEIAAYDPMSLIVTRSYDCVLARETIYRVPDKKRFINSIVACCKPKAQVSFTDYIVNPEVHDQPAIAAWRAFEKGAEPPGLVEMAELWAQAGISLRVHDDQTDYYKAEIKRGLIRFAQFMGSGVKPDKDTKKAIEKRIMTWAHRMAAIEQGMKFYRFYGLR